MGTMDEQTTFDEAILRSWSIVFDLDYNDLANPEIVIRVRDDPDDANRIHLWYVGAKLVIRLDGSLLDKVNEFIVTVPNNTTPMFTDFIEFYGKENLIIDVYSSVHFLNSSDFIPFRVPASFLIKTLSIEDKEDLDKLHSACSEFDVDESWVMINHPQLVGCYYKDLLVSAASATHFWANFADLGILTHPEFRGKGLGKTVVSALTEKILKETDKIPLYRADEKANPASFRLAQSLGFKKHSEQISLEFQNGKK